MHIDKRRLYHLDWYLILNGLALLVIGMVNLVSATRSIDSGPYNLLIKQMMAFAAGVGVMFLILAYDYRLTASYAKYFYLGTLALIIIVLVLGTDSKAGEPARSDTIMLMRFDPDTHTVNQLSIPRDTKVDVPGRGTMKLNEAMFWGGTSLAVKTIQDYVGIPVNHVLVVNFKGFPRVVNAVGGIDMYVPETVSTVAGANRRVVTFEKGWHHFDGKYAMLYVRIRYADNDFMRAERQQRFVRALQKKIAQPSNITKLPDLGRRFMSGVDTDLTTSQLLELAWVKWRSDDKKSKHWVLAGEPAYIGGIAYVLPPSADKKARIIAKFLGE